MNALSALNTTNFVEQPALSASEVLAGEERVSSSTQYKFTSLQTAKNDVHGIHTGQLVGCQVYNPQDKVIAGFWLVTAAIEVALPRGANIHKLLRGTGIFEDAITHDLMISINQYNALLTNVQAQTKGNDVGFLLGSALATTWKTSPLFALSSFDNTSDIIRTLMSEQCFRWCMAPLVYNRQYELDEHLLWIPEATIPSEKLKIFTLEIIFSCLFSLLKQITGQRVPLMFTFNTSRPRNIADFETHLGLRVSFNQPVTGIWLNKAYFDTASDVSVDKQKSAHEQTSTLRQGMSLTDFVRSNVFSNVNCGLADIAEYLGVSTATLKRKLKEHGTNYRLLSEEVMRNKAIVLLSLQKLTNEQASAQMDMSDLPNFRRTIKRLTGKTPSELRTISNC